MPAAASVGPGLLMPPILPALPILPMMPVLPPLILLNVTCPPDKAPTSVVGLPVANGPEGVPANAGVTCPPDRVPTIVSADGVPAMPLPWGRGPDGPKPGTCPLVICESKYCACVFVASVCN